MKRLSLLFVVLFVFVTVTAAYARAGSMSSSFSSPSRSYSAPSVSYSRPSVSYSAPAPSYSKPVYSAPAPVAPKPVTVAPVAPKPVVPQHVLKAPVAPVPYKGQYQTPVAPVKPSLVDKMKANPGKTALIAGGTALAGYGAYKYATANRTITGSTLGAPFQNYPLTYYNATTGWSTSYYVQNYILWCLIFDQKQNKEVQRRRAECNECHI